MGKDKDVLSPTEFLAKNNIHIVSDKLGAEMDARFWDKNGVDFMEATVCGLDLDTIGFLIDFFRKNNIDPEEPFLLRKLESKRIMEKF